jgi:heptosyltransferase-1
MSVLIVKLSALGDVIQALSAVKKYHALHPHKKISWLVEKRNKDVLKDVPFIDQLIVVDTYALRKNPYLIFKEIQRLRLLKFDQIFDLQGNFKSFLFLIFLKAKEKIGFDFFSAPEKIASFALSKKIHIPKEGSIIAQYTHLLMQKPLDEIDDNLEESKEALSYFLLLGSKWENKKLPLVVWEKIAWQIQNQKRLPVYVPYFGIDEEHLVDELKKRCPFIIKIYEPDLAKMKTMFSPSTKVIGVDSALLHLAAFSKAKTFGIFGPSSAKVYQLQPNQYWQGNCPDHISFIKRCPKLRTCKHGNCLKELPVEALLNELEDF